MGPPLERRTAMNHQGRPRLHDEVLQRLDVRVPPRWIRALDARARERGVSRSEYVRDLLAADLATDVAA